MQKKWIDMTEAERVQYRIDSNREMEGRVQEQLAIQAAAKKLKGTKQIKKAANAMLNALPPSERGGFKQIMGDLSTVHPFTFRSIGR
jgi:hypothetical protein